MQSTSKEAEFTPPDDCHTQRTAKQKKIKVDGIGTRAARPAAVPRGPRRRGRQAHIANLRTNSCMPCRVNSFRPMVQPQIERA